MRGAQTAYDRAHEAFSLLLTQLRAPALRAIVEGGTQETARASFFGGGQTGGGPQPPRVSGRPAEAMFACRRQIEGRSSAETNTPDGVRHDRLQRQRLARAGTRRRTPSSRQTAGPVAGGAWQLRASGGTQEFSPDHRPDHPEHVRDRRQPVGARLGLARSQQTRYSPQGVRSGPFLTGGDETSGSLYRRAQPGPLRSRTIVLARAATLRSRPREADAPARAVSLLSPNGSIAWQIGSDVTTAAAYRGDRTPTLEHPIRCSTRSA